MRVSLVITTYNRPDALLLVLKSVEAQSRLPSSVIIADDGSDKNTKKLIKNFQLTTCLKIIHSWQKDKGFRAAKSRNKAIAESKADYIILVDGDMVLHHNFINDHEKNCKCIECKTIPLSPRESQECNDLLNEDKNNYIQYEGVEYEYDYSSNIVSFEYDEIGIWNCDDEVVEWYNDDCEAIHLTNLSKK